MFLHDLQWICTCKQVMRGGCYSSIAWMVLTLHHGPSGQSYLW